MAEAESFDHGEGEKKARLQASNDEFLHEEKTQKQEELHQELLSPKGSHTENKELFESKIPMQPGVREKRPPFTYKTGAVYEGEWMDGVRDGHGVQNWPDGAKYEGGTHSFWPFWVIWSQNGKTTKRMATGYSIMRTATSMKGKSMLSSLLGVDSVVSGKMTKHTEKEHTKV